MPDHRVDGLIDRLDGVDDPVHYYRLDRAPGLSPADVAALPRALKCLLENSLRQYATGRTDGSDIARIGRWLATRSSDEEIAFQPVRMIMVESSGLPLFGDMAAMRDVLAAHGVDPARLNPAIAVDLIVDHSGRVDSHARPDAATRNLSGEFVRNRERYRFLRWAGQSFNRVRVFRPGVGICHQINLECLASVVSTVDEGGRTMAVPDSLVGMDSHTPMINGLGVIGWGVGGLEGGAAALGLPVSMLIPSVTGVRLRGRLRPGVTTTDLVLSITERLRRERLQGQFIEYSGDGLSLLTIPERATIANMTPECGATMGYFPIDEQTLDYLRLTGRPETLIRLVRAYAKAQGLWHGDGSAEPVYSTLIDIDLDGIEPVIAGPTRPHQRTPLNQSAAAFRMHHGLTALARPEAEQAQAQAQAILAGSTGAGLRDGDVVLAAITSCTNTSNPRVMIGAGLLAQRALARGLRPKPWVKTSLAPGSLAVAQYLEAGGLQTALDALGFHTVGFGCMTCMGNSGPLMPGVSEAIAGSSVTACAVLSGNRNFEGRVHAQIGSNFLASPPLVVAYALAGSMLVDLTTEPLGLDPDGLPVYLRDIWPDDDEITRLVQRLVTPDRFEAAWQAMSTPSPEWDAIAGPKTDCFAWDETSSFIRRPPFFEAFSEKPALPQAVRGARILALLGDMVTTDHISPFGVISPGTPADRYLQAAGIDRANYENYAARRLNHDVMIRGTFSNVHLRNDITPGIAGSSTRHFPDGEAMSIFDAAERYRAAQVPVVIVAGKEYGAGSSRDWAAKGTRLLGVRAVLAESFERIHRSNLVGMGVLPLEFLPGDSRHSLGLDGSETIDIALDGAALRPRQQVDATIRGAGGAVRQLQLQLRLDTTQDVDHYRHGGIYPFVLRQLLRTRTSQPMVDPT